MCRTAFALLGLLLLPAAASAGDRGLMVALDRGAASLAAASRAAAAGSPSLVQVHYDRARDLQEQVRAAAPFSFGSPDFNFRSLRGTAVVRYEYRPGSTLFFVWTQERADADGISDFDPNHSYKVVSRAPANNVFLIKVAHHFDL